MPIIILAAKVQKMQLKCNFKEFIAHSVLVFN